MNTEFWQNRYETETTGWDIGAVSLPLKTYFDQMSDKTVRICIPGCGFGHEAIYLNQQGFTNVTVIDLVEKALKPIENTSVRGIVGDFFEHTETYDLIIEQTFFCAISPEMRDKLVRKVYELLYPGGKWVGVLFNREFEGGPPFGGSLNEYRMRLSEYFEILTLESCYNSIPQRAGSEVFFIAQKPI